MTHNPNCNGSSCQHFDGEVKRYPIGKHEHAVLCRACWRRENQYHQRRGWVPIDWYAYNIYQHDTHSSEIHEYQIAATSMRQEIGDLTLKLEEAGRVTEVLVQENSKLERLQQERLYRVIRALN